MRLITAQNYYDFSIQEVKRIIEMLNKEGRHRKLSIIQVGNNPASTTYVNNKIKLCREVGIEAELIRLDENISLTDLILKILSLREDFDTTGILVQLPLPERLQKYTNLIMSLIPYEKDVDGFSDEAIARIFRGESCSKVPCTPEGIIDWLTFEGVNFEGKNVVIINRSNIVGKPLALLLTNMGATVTVCHSKTDREYLKLLVKHADIVVVGVGKAGFFNGEFEVKDGAWIVDVGINRNEEGKLCGDVKVEDFEDKDVTITKVPGGVGKTTTISVIKNLL